MELQINGEWVFNGVVSLAIFFIGVWFKGLGAKLLELKGEIKEIRQTYQSKELAKLQSTHTDTLLKEIRDELKSMNYKLDNKADK